MKNKYHFIKDSIKEVFKKNIIIAFLLFIVIILGMFLNVIPSIIIKQIVDTKIKSGLYEGVWILAIIYLIATSLLTVSDFIREYVSNILGQKILLNIRFKMLNKLEKIPISYFSNTPVGETISRLTIDVEQVNSLFSSGLIGIIADCLKVLGLFFTLFILSWQLGLLAIIGIPIIYILANFFRKRSFRYQLDVRKKVSAINIYIQEIFSGIKTIKIFGQEKKITEDFIPVLRNHRLAMNKNSFIDSIFPVLMQIFRTLIIIMVVFIATKDVTPISIGLSIGALTAAIDLFTKIFAPIEALAMEFQTIQQSFAGLNRITEFMENDIEQRGIGNSIEIPRVVTITLNDIHFGYSPNKKVLKGVSLKINPHEKIVLVGKTGAGKTSIMNLITGLYKPNSGSILINEINPYTIKSEQRRKLMGIVMQNIQIFDGTVLENITLRDPNIAKEAVEKAAKLAHIHEKIMSLKDRYDTKIGEGENFFSNGEMQLLSLARALVTDPPILLLDEMTSGLDSKTETKILNTLKVISKDKTIVSISHRISGVIDADTIYIIDNGVIVESGSPKELLKKDGWYSYYSKIDELGWKL